MSISLPLDELGFCDNNVVLNGVVRDKVRHSHTVGRRIRLLREKTSKSIKNCSSGLK